MSNILLISLTYTISVLVVSLTLYLSFREHNITLKWLVVAVILIIIPIINTVVTVSILLILLDIYTPSIPWDKVIIHRTGESDD